MNAKDFYLPIYEMFDSVTPLSKDCGILCKGACCKDGACERKGMILFPGEEIYLRNKGFEIQKSGWKYGDKEAYILFCSGRCNRKFRPLSCRIFPLVPIIHGKQIKAVMNPLAKRMCPLARSLKPSQLEPDFTKNVCRALNRVAKLKDGKAFLKMLSDVAEDFIKL